MSSNPPSTALLSEHRLADLSALVRVLAQINRSLDPADVFKSSLEGIQCVVGGDYGCFLLLQPNAPALQLVGASGLPPSLREQLLALTPKLGTDWIKPDNLVETIAGLGDQVRQVLAAQGLASFVLLPLTAQGRAIGILFVGTSAGKVLPPLSVDLLTSIGEQIGMAIEHARLHAALAESEEWYRAFIENSPDGFWESSIDGAVLYANESASRILGYSREELLKMRRSDFLTIDQATYETRLADLLQTSGSRNRIGSVRVKSGAIRFVSFTVHGVRDAQGRISRLQATFRDITEQEKLLVDLQRRNQELDALNAIANILRSPLEVAQSMDQVCEQIATITGMESVTIHLIDESRQCLNLAACRGISEGLCRQVSQLGLDDLVIHNVAVEGQPVALNDVVDYEGDSFAGPRSEGYHAGIGVPIIQRDRPVGMLFVGSKVLTKYESSDVALLSNIGSQIGNALENARLYAQMERRVQELDGLAQLSAACVASLDPETLAQTIADQTVFLMHVDTCTVRMVEGETIQILAGTPRMDGGNPTPRIQFDAIVRSIIEERKPYLISDLMTDTVANPLLRAHLTQIGMRAILSVPMVARDRAIGVLSVGTRAPHEWQPRERDLMQTIANQTANALDNARLFQKVVNEQRKVQAIFDSGLSGLYATDAAGNIVMFNRAAERMTGWTLAEVCGKNWIDLLSDRAAGNKVESLLEQALLHKQATYAPEGRKLRTRDGRIIPVAKASAPLLDEKENVIGAVGAFWDLTKEQRAEIEYENFLAMIAHQLRSPLSSVLSALELFERRNLPDKQRAELWAIIKAEGNQLKRLADQFLEHQAAAKSPRPLQLETLSLVVQVRQIVHQFQAAHSQHRYRIQTSRDAPLVLADAHRVEQVLRNLLDNAVSYSPAGSCITIRIIAPDAEWADVSVQDHGAGIPPAEQDHIFQPFYRVPQTSARRVYGHGLGLSLAKDMVTAMGGRIWVESEPQHGATFHFTLRRAR